MHLYHHSAYFMELGWIGGVNIGVYLQWILHSCDFRYKANCLFFTCFSSAITSNFLPSYQHMTHQHNLKRSVSKNKGNNFWSCCGDIQRAWFSLLLLLTCIQFSLPYTWSAQYLQNSILSILLYYEYYTIVNKLVWLECSGIIIFTGRRKIISNVMVKSYKNYAWTLCHFSLMSLVMLKAQCTWLTNCYHGHEIK